MAIDRTKTPPSWHPTAVPTASGWVAPETGELLVSIKGLQDPVDYNPRTKVLGEFLNRPKVKIQASRKIEKPQPETSEKPVRTTVVNGDQNSKAIEDIGAMLANAAKLQVATLPVPRGRGRPKGATNKTPEEKAKIKADREAKKQAKANKDK